MEALRSESRRLNDVLGRKAESIWQMNKEELIELARKEMGISRTMAEKETVVTLREKIRQNRTQQQQASNPLLSLPKGLERMTAEQLLVECELRGLDISPLPGSRGGHKTRPQMIIMIRAFAEQSSMTSATASREESPRQKPSTSHPRPSTAGAWETQRVPDDDWEMSERR